MTITASAPDPGPDRSADVVHVDFRRNTDHIDSDEPAARRRRMVAQLRADGVLTDMRLAAAMGSLSRHEFAQDFTVVTNGRPTAHHQRDDAARGRAWNAVYDTSTSPVISRHLDGTPELVMPSPADTARLLQLADLNRVALRTLHLGTGTGYTASLMGLLTGNVTTVERDAVIYGRAQGLLGRSQRIGVRVLPGDGHTGVADRAPFDRVVSSCDVTRVPGTWVRQTVPGGRIVTTVAGQPIALTRDDTSTAHGSFADGGPVALPTPLLPADWIDPAPKLAELAEMAARGGREFTMPDGKQPPTVPDTGFQHRTMKWLLAVVMPHVHVTTGPKGYLLIDLRTSSWAHGEPGTRVIKVGGVNGTLWPKVYSLWASWERAARPTPSAFSLTVTAYDEHFLTPPEGDPIVLTS